MWWVIRRVIDGNKLPLWVEETNINHDIDTKSELRIKKSAIIISLSGIAVPISNYVVMVNIKFLIETDSVFVSSTIWRKKILVIANYKMEREYK